jgi:hypothetical protein
MNPRWLRPGDGLAAAGGILLLVALFLPWYEVRPGIAGLRRLTGWDAFSVIDILLALVAVLGIAVAVAVMTRRSPALPISLGVVGSVAGAIASVLVLVRILDQPGPNELLDVAAGAWLGLAGALGVAAGSWWSIKDERNRGVPPVPVELRRSS